MELRRRLSPKYIFVALYFVCFVLFLVIGLRPTFVALATDYDLTGKVLIPSIGLTSDVARLSLTNGKLDTPDTIVGSYQKNPHKIFLFGHSSTVFNDLHLVQLGEQILYNGATYQISNIVIVEKSEIKMNKLLQETPRDTLVIMTCAGELLEGGDATHRLLVTAIRN